jgi:hypothetical protein
MFAVLSLIALGLGYLVGQPEKAPLQKVQAVSPIFITNVVTNVVQKSQAVSPATISLHCSLRASGTVVAFRGTLRTLG